MNSRACNLDSSRFCTAGEGGGKAEESVDNTRRTLRVNVGVVVGVIEIVSVDNE